MKRFPLDKVKVHITSDSDSFKLRDFSIETEIPVENHCGAFGVPRKYDTHTGVDLYCPEGEKVYAIEDGIVVRIEHFTGKAANSDWWKNTMAVHIEGESGVIVYGEIQPDKSINKDMKVKVGQLIGTVRQVLKTDKGRPMCMLHVELYKHGSRQTCIWHLDKAKNENLLNPTDLLISLIPQPMSVEERLLQSIIDSMDHNGLSIELSSEMDGIDYFRVDEEMEKETIRTYISGEYLNSHMFLYTFVKMLQNNEVEIVFKENASNKDKQYLEKLSKSMVEDKETE